MKLPNLRLFVFLAVLPRGDPAYAEVVSFEGFSEGLYASVEETGFIVSNELAFFVLEGAASCSPPCVENGTHYLATQNGDSPIVLRHAEDRLFALLSFEYAEQHVGLRHCPEVVVIGHQLDGTQVTVAFELDGLNDGAGPVVDFQHAELPPSFQSLTSVSFVCATGISRYSLDSLELGRTPEVPVLPTLAKTLLLLLLLGAAMVSRASVGLDPHDRGQRELCSGAGRTCGNSGGCTGAVVRSAAGPLNALVMSRPGV